MPSPSRSCAAVAAAMRSAASSGAEGSAQICAGAGREVQGRFSSLERRVAGQQVNLARETVDREHEHAVLVVDLRGDAAGGEVRRELDLDLRVEIGPDAAIHDAELRPRRVVDSSAAGLVQRPSVVRLGSAITTWLPLQPMAGYTSSNRGRNRCAKYR